MFAGRSILRSAEAKPPPPVNKALQDYLSKYVGSGGATEKKKKKKKKPKSVAAGVRIVDEDVSGFAVPSTAPDADEEDDGMTQPASLPCQYSRACLLHRIAVRPNTVSTYGSATRRSASNCK